MAWFRVEVIDSPGHVKTLALEAILYPTYTDAERAAKHHLNPSVDEDGKTGQKTLNFNQEAKYKITEFQPNYGKEDL